MQSLLRRKDHSPHSQRPPILPPHAHPGSRFVIARARPPPTSSSVYSLRPFPVRALLEVRPLVRVLRYPPSRACSITSAQLVVAPSRAGRLTDHRAA
ncbi:hypothetical protein FB451DRAFT_1416045 [Mycena latifolia]|nr:hypothetical protein FB451DRAFT_1416045 [Mycena latifolia]